MGKKGEVKKIIQRGLEGLKKVGEGVAAVGLNEILKAEKMARVVSLSFVMDQEQLLILPAIECCTPERSFKFETGRTSPSFQSISHGFTEVGS